MKSPWKQVMQTCARLMIKPGPRVLVVRIASQTLQFLRDGKVVKNYVISTSRRPPSNVKNSLGTPRGLHEIARRIGAGQPPGVVFKSRVPTGRHFSEFPDTSAGDNLITTRILWLRGLEPGVNCGGAVDTHDRYIYIHGTNHEDRLGQPFSSGCVLMSNHDILGLYDEVRVRDQVLIID